MHPGALLPTGKGNLQFLSLLCFSLDSKRPPFVSVPWRWQEPRHHIHVVHQISAEINLCPGIWRFWCDITEAHHPQMSGIHLGNSAGHVSPWPVTHDVLPVVLLITCLRISLGKAIFTNIQACDLFLSFLPPNPCFPKGRSNLFASSGSS